MRRLIKKLFRKEAERLSEEVVSQNPVDTGLIRYLPFTGSIAEAARLQEHINQQIRDMFLTPSHLLGEKPMKRIVNVYEQEDGSFNYELVPSIPMTKVVEVATEFATTASRRHRASVHTAKLVFTPPAPAGFLGSFATMSMNDDGSDDRLVSAEYVIIVDDIVCHPFLEIDLKVQSDVDDCHTYHFTAGKDMQDFKTVSDSCSGTVYTLSPGSWSEALCRRIMELEAEVQYKDDEIQELWAK